MCIVVGFSVKHKLKERVGRPGESTQTCVPRGCFVNMCRIPAANEIVCPRHASEDAKNIFLHRSQHLP